ncbi:MAG: hypothetical protein Q8O67_04020 [Deltaproteobacteria bacterium]|nr:hypothetical protein [Deltaproteobacteria bacterium]
MTIDVRKVRTAALLMHFDAAWVARILDGGDLLLNDDEKALFAPIDRRAFRADEERKARAAAAVVDELPVAVAVAGLPRLFAFFTDPGFLVVIDQGRPLVEAVAAFLGRPALIEGSIARARRRRRSRGPFTLARGVDAERSLGVGSVALWTSLRASLGPDPAGAVMRGARVTWDLPHEGEVEGVVVDEALTDPRVAVCSQELGVLLLAARSQGRDDLLGIAKLHGCDDDEAAALLLELQADGLLASV